jgi:2-amino-4-hydroxy-6-hydroxymethyldihydropteridine diphosphokinase
MTPAVSNARPAQRADSAGATHRAVLALGSNLGHRQRTLQAAVDMLADVPEIEVVAVSPVYETTPVGGPPGQDPYLNAVVLVDTALPARALLERCLVVEQAYGRRRSERWGARTLDIDVITYDNEVRADPDLMLPHPRAHERPFVLVPWLAVDPNATLPGHGAAAGLPAAAASDDVVRRHDLPLRMPAQK